MAFIFDMNGTMINDMHYHNEAWHKIFESLGSTLTEAETSLQIFGKADEIFERILGKDHAIPTHEIEAISQKKEAQYHIDFLPHLKLIDGLAVFLEKAHMAQIPMSIGTAAPQSNIDYVFKHLDIKKYFAATVSAQDVTKSKPDPEVFLKCAALMQVSPQDCIVFEDSPKGIAAAQNAGMQSVALTTFHPASDFDAFDNIMFIIADYHNEKLQQLLLKRQ